MLRFSITMLSVTATTLLLASAPVSAATHTVHRHRHAHLYHRVSPPIVAAEPYGVPLDEVGPDHYPNNGGEDELGAADGIRAGQDGTPGPRDYSGAPLASTSPRGYEIDGPPIYPALPILPEYVDPAIYR